MVLVMEFLFPKFPRTKHLPHKPNATSSDKIATEEECACIFSSTNVEFTEKIDGSNTAIIWKNSNLIISNRNNILNKGYNREDTSAKAQYRPIWNWAYEHIENFEKLENLLGFCPVIYGEWLYARHTIKYDQLPSFFIFFDIYNGKDFIHSGIARDSLAKSGFDIVPLIKTGKISSYGELDNWIRQKSIFSSTDMMEGIYIKIFDSEKITNRFKIVRKDFIQGEHWTKSALIKNQLKNQMKIFTTDDL